MLRAIRLKQEAREAAENRGHIIFNFKTIKTYRPLFRGTCKACGMEVDVIPKPMPNETYISGPAVALDCLVEVGTDIVIYYRGE